MGHRLCYQQHSEESAGGAGAELMLCCAVLCLLLDKVSSQGTGHVTSLCPFDVGGRWRGLFRVPREHSLGQMPLVGLTCFGSGDSYLPS